MSNAPFDRSEVVPGVRLVTESMPHVRSVSIGFWIDVGARDETDDIAGASHFLEHMLFKGTASRSALDIATAFDAIGGEVNAYSAREHTCVYARVLDRDLEMATDALCDMFSNAALRPEEFESERNVVLEEIHMAADVPEDRVHDLFAETAWPAQALGRSVLGSVDTIGALSRDRLADFYRAGYIPDRLVVGASGSFDADDLAGWLRRGLHGGTAPARRAAAGVPRFAAPVAAYERRDSEQLHVVWGTEAFSRTDRDRYALAVLNTLYSAGMSSRLFQEVREKRGLAYSIYGAEHLYVDGGMFTVYAGTQPESASEVLKITRDEAAKIAEGDASDEEVERAKGQVRGSLVLSMDDPGGRMSRLGRSELVHGEVVTVDELLARVDAVTTDDVARVGRRVFAGAGAVLACVGQVAEGSLDFATERLAD